MKSFIKEMLDGFDDCIKVVNSSYLCAKKVPKPKQSVSFGRSATKNKGKPWGFIRNDKVEYVDDLIKKFGETSSGATLYGPLRMTIVFSFPWTKNDPVAKVLGWMFRDKRPDLDNLIKPVSDALERVCIKEDSQVVIVKAQKIFFEEACIGVKLDQIMPNREWLWWAREEEDWKQYESKYDIRINGL